MRGVLRPVLVALFLIQILLPACQESSSGTMVRFEPDGGDFYALPYPMQARYDADTRVIDLSDFPNPGDNYLVNQVLERAQEPVDGFGLLPVVSMAFSARLDDEMLPDDVNAPPPAQPLIFFLNVDPDSPGYGERIPAITAWYDSGGNYVGENVLTFAPWNGFPLRPGTWWAAVVLRELRDADGNRLGAPDALVELLKGRGDSRLTETFAPLARYLDEASDLAVRDIAAATVFRTGDPVARMRADVLDAVAHFADRVTAATPWSLIHSEDAMCVFTRDLWLPQFQQDEPPFAEAGSGRIARDADGRLVLQRMEAVKTILVVPRGVQEPENGFPYLEYIHGSGGIATQIVDRGPVTEVGGSETPWRGPGWIAALHGYASGAQAMPISPDRVPGVADYDYVQITNIGIIVDNFTQGVIELALRRHALADVTLAASACPGVLTSDGVVNIDTSVHATMGQSMGAMYTNMFGAVTEGTQAMIPTGSGGYWSFFIFSTEFLEGAGDLVRSVIGASTDEPVSNLHPAMGLFQQFAEAVDPIVFVPRLVQDPLPGVNRKHMYVPHGRNDVYFSDMTQRAMASAYGIPLAGEPIDPLIPANLS
ncbi:MAG: hypothetical protein D6761_11745, partial [Candidatus Dadabacteria bacterium]